MGAHNTLTDLMEAVKVNPIQDPGNAGTLEITGSGGFCTLSATGSESRVLPSAAPGTKVLVYLPDNQAVTLADSQGTVATLAQEVVAECVCIAEGSSYEWRAVLYKFGVS